MRRGDCILFLTGRLTAGGSEQVLARHAGALARDGFRVEILALDPGGPGRSAYDSAGIPVFGPARPLGYRNLAAFARLLRQRCRRGGIGLVHAWLGVTTLLGPLVARSSGVPHVLVSQRNLGHWLNGPKRLVYRWSNALLADRLVVNSDSVARRVLAERLCPPEKIVVIRNGVDTERFRPEDSARARTALGLPVGIPTIGMVGTLKALKGQDDLLAALEHLADGGSEAHVVFVGEGPAESGLRERVRGRSWQRRVTFLGRREDVETVYPALDIVVVCSRAEGLPNVVLEAMACGRALVTTPVGGIPEVARHGVEALHVAPGDVSALAAAIDRLLREETLRRALGEAARQRIESEFTFPAMQERFSELYRSFLEPSRDSSS